MNNVPYLLSNNKKVRANKITLNKESFNKLQDAYLNFKEMCDALLINNHPEINELNTKLDRVMKTIYFK